MWPWRRTPTRLIPFEFRNRSASGSDVSMGSMANFVDIHWRTIMAYLRSGGFLGPHESLSPLQIFVRQQTCGDEFDLPVPQEIRAGFEPAERVGIVALTHPFPFNARLLQREEAQGLLDRVLGK